jgi:LacI family transcriptional regulator/LacI family purine nucleotide synthesis repressor
VIERNFTMPTIHDVAAAAGVSKSTVSLVCNNSPKVKMETKYKVLNAIEKLGYTPNLAAVELTTKRKLTLGMILVTNHDSVDRTAIDTMDDNYFHDVSSGIYEVVRNSNYGVLVEQFTATEKNADKFPNIVKNNRVDGLFIVGGLFDKSFINNIIEKNIPTVVLGRNYPGIDSVNTDSKFATYIGVQHLIEKGHRDILFISCPELTPSSKMKDDGYKLALIEAGIPFREEYYTKSDFHGLGGYLAVKDALENRNINPTAIFTSHDSIAVGVMNYLYEKNIRIPDAISIATYDDSILATHAVPALTSVNINKPQIGIQAANLLINRIERPNDTIKSIIVPVNLVERHSTRSI